MATASLNAQERKYFEHIAALRWLHDTKILVSTSAVTIAKRQSKAIVAVCDTAFDNVPRRWLGKAPLTHAVGYTDGTTGLLSVEDFKRLDLSRFVDVTTIPKKQVSELGVKRTK